MKSWISAKKVFHTAMSGATKFPMWVMRSPMTKGWPWALARMLASTKPRPNMNGWNCSAESRTQKKPSTICSTRWDGTARENRRAGSAACLLVPLPELVSWSMALGSGYRAAPGPSGRPDGALFGQCLR